MIKNMNGKITKSQLSTTKPKKQKQKLSKQLEQEQNQEMEITWRVFSRVGERGEWEEEGRNGGKVQGRRSIIGSH